MSGIIDAWEKKLDLVSVLEEKLSRGELEKCRRDPHSWRIPRPCGLTVHTGIGCSFRCIYCYIYDMGFTHRPRPYPLSGLQISYAIASNPSVSIGINGTPLAFGAVTEPFMDETREKTLEYLASLSSLLGNPIQFSTKAFIDQKLAIEIKKRCGGVSALVTIVTTSLHELLEPGAPSPGERFKSIENLSRAGVSTALFLRPIFPGINIDEIEGIVSRSLEAGAKGIVLGSMRVTEGILARLRNVKYLHMDELLRRVPVEVKGCRQVTLNTGDLKKKICEVALSLGARVYSSACAANIEAHKIACNACDMGPCGDPDNLPNLELNEVRILGKYYGLRVEDVALNGFLKIKVLGESRKIRQFIEFVKWSTKRKVLARS